VDSDASVNTGCSAAQLFDLVWEAMVDVLGSAATATLMRRSAKRAAGRRRDLEGLVVRRSGFQYSYQVPEPWRAFNPEPLLSVRELARELSPLLIELTGPVIIRRLSAIPDLRRCQILFEERA
jgi:hypothetical protein